MILIFWKNISGLDLWPDTQAILDEVPCAAEQNAYCVAAE